MSPKITGVLAGLLLVLVGFVYFYERPKMEAEEEAQRQSQEFLGLSRQTVAKFRIANRFGAFVAEKRGADWYLLEPVETPGDWEQFESMVTAAKAVEKGRVVVGAEQFEQTDLSAFGLNPPRLQLNFEETNGENIQLLFGDDNPVGRAAYLTWTGAQKIVLTQRSSRNRFELKLIDFRDKRILPFDMDLVRKVLLIYQGKTFEMVRDGFNWRVIKPADYPGDSAEINKILGTVRAERFVDVETEALQDSTRYGLDNPAFRLDLTYENGEIRSLLLGKPLEDARVRLWYAYNSERPFVFQIEPFMTDFLRVDLGHLRYKRVFEFEREGIDQIQLAYPDSVVQCLKINDAWQVVKPQKQDIATAVIGAWIDKVHTMAVSDFEGSVSDLSAFGLTHPTLTVSLWRGESLVREVKIGAGSDGWYGMKNGSDEVFAFDDGVVTGLRLPMIVPEAEGNQAGAE